MGFSSLIKFFLPQDKQFFPLFEAAAENLVVVSKVFKQLIETYNKEEWIPLVQKIKEYENAGDNYTHTIFKELSATFITPFDREDIQTLTSALDDVVDFINGAAKRIELFKPKVLSPDFVIMAELLVAASQEIEIGVKQLRNLKNPQAINEACIKINSIENQADDLHHNILKSLFEFEKDAIELIKIKQIAETIEKAIDKTEDVSDVLKTIIIKAA